MTRDEALTQLRTLAQAATAPALSDDELGVILTGARLRDNAGLGPSDPGFVEENWDLNYAAAEAWELRAAKAAATPWLKQFTSEGSTFIKDPADYQVMADWFRDRSTVGGNGDAPSFIALDNRLPYRLRPRSELDC